MISKILIAVKDAHLMEVTEEFISGLQPAAEIKALHVIEPVPTNLLASSEESRQDASALVESTCKRLSKRFANLKVTGCIRKGTINQAIVEEATSWGADLILMGPYGRGGADEFLLGSAAKSVLPNTPCSVVLLRARHEKYKMPSSTAHARQRIS